MNWLLSLLKTVYWTVVKIFNFGDNIGIKFQMMRQSGKNTLQVTLTLTEVRKKVKGCWLVCDALRPHHLFCSRLMLQG